MRSGGGALKVEGSIVQEFNIASEVSMVTKRAPTTQHCHSGEVQQQQHQMLYLHDHKGITVLLQEIPGLKKSPWLVLQDSQILFLGR